MFSIAAVYAGMFGVMTVGTFLVVKFTDRFCA